MLYVICYVNKQTNENDYELTALEPEDWMSKNSNLRMVYAFNADDDIICNQIREKEEFELYCRKYGFVPSDYQKKCYGARGNRLMLVGFIPTNKKYKCRLVDLDTGRFVKASPAFIKRQMDIRPISEEGDDNAG